MEYRGLATVAGRFLICLLLILAGCLGPRKLYDRMERAARPDSGVQQTQLAYIGCVETADGMFHVAAQTRILAGMLAPRGLPLRLLLFDQDGELAAAYERVLPYEAAPLWCEGSRVFLHGYGDFYIAGTFRTVDKDPRIIANRGRFLHGSPYGDDETGNVLDFARGPHEPMLTREQRYGSSGGIEDDPWELSPTPIASPSR